jgi:glyoxylate reductase
MAKANIYITRLIPQEGIDLLKEECDVEVNPDDRVLTRRELLQAVRGRDGLLCLLTDKIDSEVMDAAGGILKGIANYAVGYNNIDLGEAGRRGIPVSNTPGVLTDATAEMAWALLFSAARRVVESDRFNRSGEWEGWGPLQFLGGDITGTTLGIVGAGRIGTAMALKSKGFGMKVLYADHTVNETLETELGAERADLDKLLEEADFISIHVPLTEKTTRLFGTEQFRKMKPTAYLINTSRGPVVDEAALVEALQTREIAGAGLDVYENEPAMAAGLADLENVVLTPHTGSATTNSRTNMALKAAENLLAMMRGGTPPDCVNPQALKTPER